jgi:hypothetical protein
MEGFKGDLVLSKFLIEAKSTVADSLSLKFDWLAKINREARSVNKRPALTVSFTTGNGQAIPNGEWVLIPMALFKEIVDDA